MASSAEATRLTLAHRQAQATIGDETITGVRAAWSTLDLHDLDGTFDTWFSLTSRIVRAQRTRSARLAGNYYQMLRAFELGHDTRPIVPVLAEKVVSERLATSLRVTGPVSLKSNVGRGMDLVQAAAIADENSARSGMRYALDGGRETIAQTTKADPKATGWIWQVTSDRPCDYCSNLDGVLFYMGEDVFQAHDGCDCEAVPAY